MRRLIAVLLLLLGPVAGSVGATQYLAHTFGYAPQLGQSVAQVGRVKIYPPQSGFIWWRLWGRHTRRPFAIAKGVAFGGLVLGVGLACIAAGGRRPTPEPTGAYGTARWAKTKDLADAELLDDQGVVLCQTDEARIERKPFGRDATGRRRLMGWRQTAAGQLVRHDGQEHVLVFAPTGSGKGVGVVQPTLLSWTGSAVIYDLKRENWELTSGWRSRFSHCLRFEPTVEHSVRFNPLMEVRPWPYDVRDAQSIAEIVVNPDALTEEQKDHWKLTGFDFLVAVILHVLYAEPDKSLAGVLRVMTDPERDIRGLLDAMLLTRHLGDKPHPAVAGGARAMLNRSANERSGVLSTAASFLSLYRDPLVAMNTATSDFSLADLMCSRHPVSLYLVVPPNDTDRTKPLMRLLLNFFGRRLTEHLDQVGAPGGKRRPKRHRLLYLVDEFPTLGRMPFFEVQLGFLRGYQVKCMLIAQSLNQLDKAYGHNHAILDHCHVRMTYSANCERTAKRISDMLGQQSLIKVQLSEGEKKGAFGKPHVTRSYQEYGRPLKTPDELQSLPFPDALLMVGNLRPYAARKVLVFDDPRFRGRLWDKKSALNHPLETVARQRAELPPQVGEPHWLSLPPMPVDAPHETDGESAARSAGGCDPAAAAAAVQFTPGHLGLQRDDPDAMEPS